MNLIKLLGTVRYKRSALPQNNPATEASTVTSTKINISSYKDHINHADLWRLRRIFKAVKLWPYSVTIESFVRFLT